MLMPMALPPQRRPARAARAQATREGKSLALAAGMAAAMRMKGQRATRTPVSLAACGPRGLCPRGRRTYRRQALPVRRLQPTAHLLQVTAAKALVSHLPHRRKCLRGRPLRATGAGAWCTWARGRGQAPTSRCGRSSARPRPLRPGRPRSPAARSERRGGQVLLRSPLRAMVAEQRMAAPTLVEVQRRPWWTRTTLAWKAVAAGTWRRFQGTKRP